MTGEQSHVAQSHVAQSHVAQSHVAQSHVTDRLARFVAFSQWENIAPEVRREGVRGLLNFVGCALGGARDEAMDIAATVLTLFFGPPQATVIGRSERPDALNAAFLNAVSANVLEYDDTHLATVMHPAAPVAPGLFALAELRPVSGRELLHAFILGVETSCRVGLGVMPTHYRRGWHITATCRIFGAAAASARLLGLGARQTSWALGHAATQSASLVESLGSMAKRLGVGNAAKNGLAAALFAEGGFTGRNADRGALRVCGGDQRLGRSRATDRRASRNTIGRWTVQIVKRSDTATGFVVLPRRRVVERTFALLGRNRRLAKDFEAGLESALAWLFLASAKLLMRRLARLKHSQLVF